MWSLNPSFPQFRQNLVNILFSFSLKKSLNICERIGGKTAPSLLYKRCSASSAPRSPQEPDGADDDAWIERLDEEALLQQEAEAPPLPRD